VSPRQLACMYSGPDLVFEGPAGHQRLVPEVVAGTPSSARSSASTTDVST
jgi:hypothetical protein